MLREHGAEAYEGSGSTLRSAGKSQDSAARGSRCLDRKPGGSQGTGVSDHQAILARIRRCGRIGDEREARRLYLTHGIDFRQYRSAYETGRQEARRRRIMQKGKELA